MAWSSVRSLNRKCTPVQAGARGEKVPLPGVGFGAGDRYFLWWLRRAGPPGPRWARVYLSEELLVTILVPEANEWR